MGKPADGIMVSFVTEDRHQSLRENVLTVIAFVVIIVVYYSFIVLKVTRIIVFHTHSLSILVSRFQFVNVLFSTICVNQKIVSTLQRSERRGVFLMGQALSV